MYSDLYFAKRIVDKNFLLQITVNMQEQEKIYKNRSLLDPSSSILEIVGREKQATDLMHCLMTYKKNYVVPFVSVYGRSGSGKSTLVKFICETFQYEISYIFVNLRNAKTVFGSVNLILGELGVENLKSAQGINAALGTIEQAIEKLADGKKIFVMVLDEFDILLMDKRSKPSDFVYRLFLLVENLKKKNLLTSIITISNNVLADYDLDDKVRSRIGSTEIFFEPYSTDDIFKILSKRVSDSLVEGTIDDTVLRYCAEQSSLGHGDARRAIDLLRVSAELVALDGETKILQTHVDAALDKLQKDRVVTTLATASYHQRVVCFAMARLAYLLDQDWHSTARIYSQYKQFIPSKIKPLGYRRISELLIDLENTGIVKYHTASRGKYGRDTRFKIMDLPETVGETCFSDAWKKVVLKKKERMQELEEMSTPSIGYNPKSAAFKMLAKMKEDEWNKFVGV